MKMFRRVISFVLALSLMLSLNPAVTKADSTYTMITPGLNAGDPALIPVDGTDYVASIDSGETENLYFAFDVPMGTERFYTITYKNLSVHGYTNFSVSSAAGEELFKSGDYLTASSDYVINDKLLPGRYTLCVGNREGKVGNIKIRIASRVDKVGDNQSSAKTIKTGVTVNGTLDGYCDNDYYKFVAPSNGTYEFYAKNLSINEFGYFAVYSSSEEQMYEKEYMSRNYDGNCAIKCAKGDVYYLRYAYQNANYIPSVGNYRVYVKKIGPGKVKTVKVKKTSNWNNLYVSWSKASNANGYEVQVSKNRKFKTYDSHFESGNNSGFSVSRGTYYVRVRSYKNINNSKYYGSFSEVKKISIR